MRLRKVIVGLAVVGMFAVSGPVFAQSSTGRGGNRWAPGPEVVQRGFKGFCYSERRQTCSSIFERNTDLEISQECNNSGWYRYFANQSGREARSLHDQMCRG